MADIQQTVYSGAPAGDSCAECKTSITGTYYRANGAMVCSACASRLQHQLPRDSHTAFVRAIMLGLVGFAIGLTLYAGFVIMTGISIGYLALAVGWIIGKAMMIGSKGIGGRRYQLTAVLLTYAAVSMAFVPIAFSVIKQQKVNAPVAMRQAPVSHPDSATPVAGQRDDEAAGEAAKPKMGFFTALGSLVLLGLISPFLKLSAGFSGLIGLIILYVGMQFAWKMTAGSSGLEGPFRLDPVT